MKIHNIIEALEVGVYEGESPSDYENDFRFLGMDLFISEIEDITRKEATELLEEDNSTKKIYNMKRIRSRLKSAESEIADTFKEAIFPFIGIYQG